MHNLFNAWKLNRNQNKQKSNIVFIKIVCICFFHKLFLFLLRRFFCLLFTENNVHFDCIVVCFIINYSLLCMHVAALIAMAFIYFYQNFKSTYFKVLLAYLKSNVRNQNFCSKLPLFDGPKPRVTIEIISFRLSDCLRIEIILKLL